MRAGRLPDEHPLEREARDELRARRGEIPEPRPVEPVGRWSAASREEGGE